MHSCLIYAWHNDTEEEDESARDKVQRSFLAKYFKCFLKDLPKKMPLVRAEDQRIDILPSSYLLIFHLTD